MKRTRAAVAAFALTLLAGCGGQAATDVAADPAGSPSATEPGSPSESPGAASIEHPTGADDVVLRIESGGGMVPIEYAVTVQPSLLLTGDGRLFRQPGTRVDARLIAMTVSRLDEAQVQELLGLADDAGLLDTPPDYTDTTGPQIADAGTTTVTVAARGETWRHEAYALAPEGGPARIALSEFIDDSTALVADVISEPFVPREVALYVQPTDLERDVVAWPADGVDLAKTSGCEVAPAEGLVELLSSTRITTSFRQDDALYSVSATEVLPGDQPC
ncbi:hypothetical protein BH09ACT12_BH09ACT12_32900 [soil metagenome]